MEENLEEILENFERDHPPISVALDSHDVSDVFKNQLRTNFQKNVQLNSSCLERSSANKVLKSQIVPKSEIVENIIKHCEGNEVSEETKSKPDVFFSKKITERLVNSIHKASQRGNRSKINKTPNQTNSLKEEEEKRVYVVKTYSRNNRVQKTNLRNPEFPEILSDKVVENIEPSDDKSAVTNVSNISSDPSNRNSDSLSSNAQGDSSERITASEATPEPSPVKKRGRKKIIALKKKKVNERKRSMVLKSLIGRTKQNRRRSEINRLLMDEGAVDMMYSVNNKRKVEDSSSEVSTPKKRGRKPKIFRTNMSASSGKLMKSNESYNAIVQQHNSKIIRRYSDCSENESSHDDLDDNNNDGGAETQTTNVSSISSISNTKTIKILFNTISTDSFGNYNEISLKRYENFMQIVITPTFTVIKNSLSCKVLDELSDVILKLQNDENCRAVLLTSTGSAFCHGIDFSTLIVENKEKRLKAAQNMINSIKLFLNRLIDFPKLLIAGVNGSVMGFGVIMLPLFDLVFASEKVTFSMPYGKLGYIPEATILFTQRVNFTLVKDLFYTGRKLNVTEALEKGLVTRTLWHDKFQEELLSIIIKTISDQSIQSLQITKSLINLSSINDSNNQLDNQMKLLLDCWTSDECQTRLIKALNDDEW